MEQVPYWWPTNITGQCTKFSRHSNLAIRRPGFVHRYLQDTTQNSAAFHRQIFKPNTSLMRVKCAALCKPARLSFLNKAWHTFLSFGTTAPQWTRASSFTRYLDHTRRRTTVGRTPLDEWLARRRDLYLTSHNTHDRHPGPRWDSNPQSQQESGRRPKP